jgi:hypothetical protein
VETLIPYSSFLGSSKQCAGWLHEDVPSDIMEFSKAGSKTLKEYGTMVLIGGTYAGWLSLFGYLKKQVENTPGKREVFVIVDEHSPMTGSISGLILEFARQSEIPSSIFICVGKLARSTPMRLKRKRSPP